ncbi:recombinase family protein [Streptomyces sp. NPDC089795]|uniref:recombinase family protein n=1 Tax=Streptomyces sp. NPDC089795 TaxID=3155297 RepID=UPI0034436822
MASWALITLAPIALVFLAWASWLIFNLFIAKWHGPEGLRVTPSIAQAFHPRQWAVLVSMSGQTPTAVPGGSAHRVPATACRPGRCRVSRTVSDVISARTIAALAERRAAGARLGRPRACPDTVLRRTVLLRLRGATLAEIAEEFNCSGTPTPGGGAFWYPSHVSRLLRTQDAVLLLRTYEGAAP